MTDIWTSFKENKYQDKIIIDSGDSLSVLKWFIKWLMTDNNSTVERIIVHFYFCTARNNAAFKTLNCTEPVNLQWHKMFLFTFYIDL